MLRILGIFWVRIFFRGCWGVDKLLLKLWAFFSIFLLGVCRKERALSCTIIPLFIVINQRISRDNFYFPSAYESRRCWFDKVTDFSPHSANFGFLCHRRRCIECRTRDSTLVGNRTPPARSEGKLHQQFVATIIPHNVIWWTEARSLTACLWLCCWTDFVIYLLLEVRHLLLMGAVAWFFEFGVNTSLWEVIRTLK